MENNSKKKYALIAVLIALLASSIGFNVYKLLSPNIKNNSAESNNSDIQLEIEEANKLIQEMEAEKNLALNTVDSLELSVSEWKLEVDRIKALANGNLSNDEKKGLMAEIYALKSRIKQFNVQQQTLDSVSNVNNILNTEVKNKKTEINTLNIKVTELSSNLENTNTIKNNLEEKIAKATKIQLSNLLGFGIENKKAGNRQLFDASKIDEFFVEFKVMGNNLYPKPTDEEFKIRVLGPKGELYQKAGTLIEKARQEDFTFIENVQYSGKTLAIKHSFIPKKKLQKGNYEIELFQNGVFVQKTVISLF